MSLLFSTTFYIQGNPVSYHIYIDRSTRQYFFKPTLYSNRNIYPPSFYAVQKNGNWKFEGLADKSLQSQAVDDIEVYQNIEPVG